jgi:hypothetical protein
LGSRILSFKNKRVLAPPGKIIRNSDSKNVMIASVPRSGNHLMMNFLISNLIGYKNSPLYVDLDAFFRDGLEDEIFAAQEMIASGAGLIIKTHYPFCNHNQRTEEFINSILEKTVVINCIRNSQSAKKSLLALTDYYTSQSFDHYEKLFRQFWTGKFDLQFEYSAFREGNESALSAINNHLPLKPRPYVFPTKKGSDLKIYMEMALTRLLGQNAPKINTNIAYRLSDNVKITTSSPSANLSILEKWEKDLA